MGIFEMEIGRYVSSLSWFSVLDSYRQYLNKVSGSLVGAGVMGGNIREFVNLFICQYDGL